MNSHRFPPNLISIQGYTKRNAKLRSSPSSNERRYVFVEAQSQFSNTFLKFGLTFVLLVGMLLYPHYPAETDKNYQNIWGVEKQHIAESISSSLIQNEYPENVVLSVGDKEMDVVLQYNIDPQFNEYVDELLLKYRPDFASVVAIDPKTGRLLAMSSYIRDGEPYGNLSVHSEFPAASLFKIITAAAALEQDLATPDTPYFYNGKNTSLYKSNVFKNKRNKWTRKASLSKAFAISINTVFGKLGIFHVGGPALNEYANQFGFNRGLDLDFRVPASISEFDMSDDWTIAEIASGYNRTTTISPVHAAMLASAVVNDGIVVNPQLIDIALDSNGLILYSATPSSFRAIEEKTAHDMRKLMRATVKNGSARKSFRGFFKGDNVKLDVGGKTGSITGTNPKGKTQWFAGYGDSGSSSLAVAAVVVNKEKWRVKPAYLARKVIEQYFKPEPTSSG